METITVAVATLVLGMLGWIAAEIRGNQSTKLGITVIEQTASKDAFNMLLSTVGELRLQVGEYKEERVEMRLELKECKEQRDVIGGRMEILEAKYAALEAQYNARQ